ncbi:MAG: type II toxin-antitoxin system RelE/ParE family toxin [Pseudomonadota bacterium]|nr:type II toxin-antitoxin system RelE/ParE family toxin [Pseudomonadota bacterium]
MNTLIQSSVFADWLRALADDLAKAHILRRIASAELGNFGDCEPVGEGVSEMRVHHGPGYRVYFMRRGGAIYVLLCGGSKASQKRDIKRAKSMVRELKGTMR